MDSFELRGLVIGSTVPGGDTGTCFVWGGGRRILLWLTSVASAVTSGDGIGICRPEGWKKVLLCNGTWVGPAVCGGGGGGSCVWKVVEGRVSVGGDDSEPVASLSVVLVAPVIPMDVWRL